MSSSPVSPGAGVGVVTVPFTLIAGSSYGPAAALLAVALVGTATAVAAKTA